MKLIHADENVILSDTILSCGNYSFQIRNIDVVHIEADTILLRTEFNNAAIFSMIFIAVSLIFVAMAVITEDFNLIVGSAVFTIIGFAFLPFFKKTELKETTYKLILQANGLAMLAIASPDEAYILGLRASIEKAMQSLR